MDPNRFYVTWPILILGLAASIYFSVKRWGKKGACIGIVLFLVLFAILAAMYPIMLWYFLPLGT